jgi:hypothetical protein
MCLRINEVHAVHMAGLVQFLVAVPRTFRLDIGFSWPRLESFRPAAK